MSAAKIAHLEDRGAVSVTGPDAAKLLQGLITNDMELLRRGAAARHAGLLTPQGKIQSEFFVAKVENGFVLEVARAKAGDLVKRLSMYKLRADVAIADASSNYRVHASWGGDRVPSGRTSGMIAFADPRHPDLGLRLISTAALAGNVVADLSGDLVAESDYIAHRIALGVPEGGRDYEFGDAYPHEADFDLFHGVSFAKGCYVGQEVVARMQHKTVVRKRVTKIEGERELAPGVDVLSGKVPIGRVGSLDGVHALAMLRLDRAAEAEDNGIALTAGGITLKVGAGFVDAYRSAAAARPGAAP